MIEPKNPKKRKNVGPALHSFPGLGMAKLSDKDRVVEVEHLSFTKYTNGSLALGKNNSLSTKSCLRNRLYS